MTSVSPVAENDKGKRCGRNATPNPSQQGGGIVRILTSWRAFRDSLAPLGYEDETGFHYGDQAEGGES